MSHRRLIQSLLASGRRINRVPEEVRQRIFARALAATEVAADEGAVRDRRPRCRRPLPGARKGTPHQRLRFDPRRLRSSVPTRPPVAAWGTGAGALRPTRQK